MKNMKKVILTILILALTASLGTSVYADHLYGEDGWTVTYTKDGEMTSNFGDLNEASEKLQPGDDITFTVTLKNEDSGDTNWYMSNEVLQSLEDSSNASGGAYSYLLTYSGKSTPLYDSDTVGGESISVAGEGLHEATSALKNFFFLGTLKKGEIATVTLKITLDGETQGNAYKNTLARLEMNFAAEGKTTVKTGDETRTLPLFIAMALSGGGLMCVAVAALRQRKNRREVDA